MAVTDSATTKAQRAAIRWRVRTGRYRVDPARVAAAILNQLEPPMKRNSSPALHREITPPRQCKERGCKTWLASANEDDRCAQHGGWSTHTLRSQSVFSDRVELLEELMAA